MIRSARARHVRGRTWPIFLLVLLVIAALAAPEIYVVLTRGRPS